MGRSPTLVVFRQSSAGTGVFLASVRYEKEAPGFNLFISARALCKVIVVLTCYGVQGGCESWWGNPGGEPTRAVTWHGNLLCAKFGERLGKILVIAPQPVLPK
jgi:hypothetical protein